MDFKYIYRFSIFDFRFSIGDISYIYICRLFKKEGRDEKGS